MTVYIGQVMRHGRVMTCFLSDKLKKGVAFKFTDDDSEKFQRLAMSGPHERVFVCFRHQCEGQNIHFV